VATLLAARAEEARPMAQMRDAKKRMVDELGLEFVESLSCVWECGGVSGLMRRGEREQDGCTRGRPGPNS